MIKEWGKKQIKSIEYQVEKQITALENRVKRKSFLDRDQKSIPSLFSKNFQKEEAT